MVDEIIDLHCEKNGLTEQTEKMEIDESPSDITDIEDLYTCHNNDKGSTTTILKPKPQVNFDKKSSIQIISPSFPVIEGSVYQLTWCNERQTKANQPSNGSTSHIEDSNLMSTIENELTRFINMANNLDVGGSGDLGRPPPSSPKLMFKDCGGLEKQIKFIRTAIIGPLCGENPDQYDRFGLEPPKGILFYGVPGTGKTRLAQALSNEISEILGRPVNFIYRKGNDVASKWFGQSSENLRQVFDEAKQQKPSVLFFDELDGLCPSRDKPYISEAYVTIVTTMLGLMDELHRGEVFVIGATNKMDGIDPALRRPGRFDKYLEFLPPTQQGRQEILAIHTNNWKSKPSADVLTKLSQQTSGFSGADLAKLCLDAFDRALNQEIALEKQRKHIFTYRNVSLDNLAVSEDDWQFALTKMKPSTMGVFGSAQYIPQNKPTAYIQPLLQESLQSVKQHLSSLLSKQIEAQSGIWTGIVLALYIWSENESCLSTLNDFIISPLFGNDGGEAMNNYTKYFLSPEVLYSTSPQNWPKTVNETFSQAIASHVPSILYISDVEELCLAIKNYRLSEAINLKHQLERLRDTHVLLLVTGSSPPEEFSWDNPFSCTLTSEASALEIQRPSDAERHAFFGGLHVPEQFRMKWEDQDGDVDQALIELHNLLVMTTNEEEHGNIVALFDYVQQELASTKTNPTKTSGEVLMSIFEVVGSYKISRALSHQRENMDTQGKNSETGDDDN